VRYKFNTRWNGKVLRCACLYGNPCCDRFRTCEVLEVKISPFADIEECMKARSYKRTKGGAIREKE
jgi:hypothetical protein